MLNKNKIAVISSGNGGQSMAAYFAKLGYDVALYVREKDRAEMFPKNGVFMLRGVVEGDPVVKIVSHDMEEVVRDAYLIMVTTPAQYQPIVAKEMARHLQDGQMVVLNPGRTFGSYVYKKVLEDNEMTADIILAEVETFVFACRCVRVAEPYIYGIKGHVRVAAHVPKYTANVAIELARLFPGSIEEAKSVFHTSFSNIGMIFHPLPILLNMTRVEAQEKFLFYKQGISPLVANILERVDKERVTVAAEYGVEVQSAYQWLLSHYESEGDSLYERIQNTEAYQNIYAPIDIDTRYIYEDMLTGCVPMMFAGQAVGIETPVIKSAILWASTIYETDFVQNGRNDTMLDYEELKRDANIL